MLELDDAVRNFKNKEAPGPSGVPIEAIELLDETSKLLFLHLLKTCINSVKVSRDVNKADLAVIFKKGATDKPENYHPIACLLYTSPSPRDA
eukprot:13396943-Heterocapsa_arctica.AAC.1